MDPTTDTPAPTSENPLSEAVLASTPEAPPAEAVSAEPPAQAAETKPVIWNGEVLTPETHRFKDGVPVFGKNGKPLRRPGPQKNAAPKAPKAPKQAAASVPASADTASQPTEAPTAALAAPAPAPAPAQVRAASAVVSRVYGKIGAVEAKNEELEVRTFVTQPASVEIGYGLTLNIGNYESARVDVKISVPCYAEEANAAYDFAKKWAEERVQAEVKEIRKIASGIKSSSPF